jgi:hypothetical protein
LKKLIYSKEDLDLILCLETEKYEDKINNLQSKIDKANEILDKYANTEVEDYKKIMKFYKELRDILKEDK